MYGNNYYVPPHRRTLRKHANAYVDQVLKDKALEDQAAEANRVFGEEFKKRTPKKADEKQLKRLGEQSKNWASHKERERLNKAVEAANKGREAASYLKENPHLDPKYVNMTKEEVQEALKNQKLTGADYAKIDPRKLKAGQNLRALGHELKSQSYLPHKAVKRGWDAMGEGGGGWVSGNRMGRHNIMIGGKSLTGVFALGDYKDAFNKADPLNEGRSRTERLGYASGGVLGGVLGTVGAKRMARVPGGFLGNLVVQGATGIGGMMAGYYAGGKAGKYLDKGVSSARGVTSGDYKQDLLRRAGVSRKKDGTY